MERDRQTSSIGLARAKINLTLHVGASIQTGLYTGYHPVDSLVVFADIADRLTYDARAGKAGELALGISGPFSKELQGGQDNLILKAARLFFDTYHIDPRGKFHLIKNLPLASGIGGGSADAAAALRLLAAEFKTDSSSMMDLAPKIGADVPVCYPSQTAHMQGIGEHVELKSGFDSVAAILVNPGFAVSTAQIFKMFDSLSSQRGPLRPQVWKGDLYDVACAGHNDLQDIAISLRPEIKDVVAKISMQAGCRLARMSGSGATCFGLFNRPMEAEAAAQAISLAHPNYWCHAVTLGSAA